GASEDRPWGEDPRRLRGAGPPAPWRGPSMTETPPLGKKKILIVDDHPVVREGLALRIGRQPDLEVCGEAGDVGEALQVLGHVRPDVAIIDIALKSGSGLDLIKRVK